MDSYYTSPALAVELSEENIGICGTVNRNRKGMPASLKPAVLGTTIFFLSPQSANSQPNFSFLNPQPQVRN